jgi:hypothetical protein
MGRLSSVVTDNQSPVLRYVLVFIFVLVGSCVVLESLSISSVIIIVTLQSIKRNRLMAWYV